MALEDLIAQFEGLRNPSDENAVNIDSVIESVTGIYNTDLNIRDTAVQEKERIIGEKDEEIKNLKLTNYDLTMKIPGDNVNSDTPKKPSGDKATSLDEMEPSERAASIRISDLFERKKL